MVERAGFSIRRLAILCIALIAGGAASETVAQVFDEYPGAETFHRFCASCHGETGRGNGPVAAGLPIAVPDLTLLRQRQGDKFPAATLRKIIDGRDVVIYHGTRYMPVWGYEFWVQEGADAAAQQRVEIIIDNLIDYLASIQR
ncbi:MAG: c-type cytochrome [Gammaproteobacteria bacterium]